MKEVSADKDATTDNEHEIGERIEGDGEWIPGVPGRVVADVFAKNPAVEEVAHERSGKEMGRDGVWAKTQGYN